MQDKAKVAQAYSNKEANIVAEDTKSIRATHIQTMTKLDKTETEQAQTEMSAFWRKSKYYVSGMDCPCEERLIRMATEGLEGLTLKFDLDKRELIAYHRAAHTSELAARLEGLKLGARLIGTTSCEPPESGNVRSEQRLLIIVLIINFSLFVLECAMGMLSGSMGLIGDSLDMLADAFVYGLSLYATGRSLGAKKNVATISGYIQILLAVVGVYEVIQRFVFAELPPDFGTMIYISLIALVGNATCLYLLQRTEGKEAHIQASIIFSANDVLINIGVILSAGLVWWLSSPLPDLIVGGVIFVLVFMGAMRILRLGRS